MEIRLLGPVEVRVADRPVEIGPPRQRAVLAALAVEPARPVQLDSLVDRVWGHRPPHRVREALYVYIGRIRKALAGAAATARLVRQSHAYLLDVDPDRVDLHRFGSLVAQARRADQPDAARAATLRSALDIWYGAPLADVSGEWAARIRDAAQRQRLEATIEWAEVELRLGHPERVVGPLTDMAAEHPLVEPVAATLMRALHALGRGAEALECFARIRRQMVDELGLDPGPDLRRVHRLILRGGDEPPAPPGVRPDRARAAPSDRVGAGPSDRVGAGPSAPAEGPADRGRPMPRPAQLPADIPVFAGRREHLDRLDGLAGGGAPTTVVISAIAGTGGVGKTALAVHWGHRARRAFPDGQLYVNLRGFDPSGRAMSPHEAVRGFLEALGVPPERAPRGLAAQAAMYRSLLDGRRVLIVLDNARDAEQVRPLLPGSPTAMVLVTSRNPMSGLVAVDGAYSVPLSPLTPDEARDVLARRLGPDRTAAEPEAVEEITARCARLPLALTIAAARAVDPSVRLEAVAAELADAGRRLDVLSAGDPASDVRAVLSWSYATLSDEAAELFRLLGLHPGPDVTEAAAASLAGVTVEAVRPRLVELTAASLLTQPTPGRYTFHDLLRAYAADLARARDPEDRRRAAVRRAIDHYLHTAHRADRLLDPHRDPMVPALEPVAPGVTPEHLGDASAALTWTADEYAVLVATTELADGGGEDVRAWQLAWSVTTFLTRRGPWYDLATVWRAGLAAADRLEDRAMRALAHRTLGHANTELDRHDEADHHHRRALDLYARVGDDAGRAQTHRMLATLGERTGRLERSLEHAREAVALSEAAGHPAGQAGALNALGWYHALLGDPAQARVHCEHALELFQRLDDRHGQADTWDSLGFVHNHLNDHDLAVECYRQALALYRAMGDRYYEAATLIRLGETHEAATRAVWRSALDILIELEHPVGDALRARLDNLDRGDPARRQTWLEPRTGEAASGSSD